MTATPLLSREAFAELVWQFDSDDNASGPVFDAYSQALSRVEELEEPYPCPKRRSGLPHVPKCSWCGSGDCFGHDARATAAETELARLREAIGRWSRALPGSDEYGDATTALDAIAAALRGVAAGDGNAALA